MGILNKLTMPTVGKLFLMMQKNVQYEISC